MTTSECDPDRLQQNDLRAVAGRDDPERIRPQSGAPVFSVMNVGRPYQPRIARLPSFDYDSEFRTADIEHGPVNGSYQLVIGYRAREIICDHIGWGTFTEANAVERGGILLGEVIDDPESRMTVGVVSSAVPARAASGSAAHIRFETADWLQMLEEADGILAAGERAQVIGWYHTHPRQLAVFMSGTDRATQDRMFREPWHSAIVLNPNTKVWRAFHGPNCLECAGFALKAPAGSGSRRQGD